MPGWAWRLGIQNSLVPTYHAHPGTTASCDHADVHYWPSYPSLIFMMSMLSHCSWLDISKKNSSSNSTDKSKSQFFALNVFISAKYRITFTDFPDDLSASYYFYNDCQITKCMGPWVRGFCLASPVFSELLEDRPVPKFWSETLAATLTTLHHQ